MQGSVGIWQFRRDIPGKIGIFPRHATDGSQVRWFTVEPFCVSHTACAWEEVDADDGQPIVVVVTNNIGHESFSPTFPLETPVDPDANLHEYRFHIGSGRVSERALCGSAQIFQQRTRPGASRSLVEGRVLSMQPCWIMRSPITPLSYLVPTNSICLEVNARRSFGATIATEVSLCLRRVPTRARRTTGMCWFWLIMPHSAARNFGYLMPCALGAQRWCSGSHYCLPQANRTHGNAWPMVGAVRS